MDNKIGKRELEIIEYLQAKGEATHAQLLVDFSPQINVRGKNYSQYNVVEQRLLRLQEKKLIAVERRGAERIVRLND